MRLTPDSEFAAMLRRVAATAAKRGERIVGYHGSLDGYFRFDFAKITCAKRGPFTRPVPKLERVVRGVRMEPVRGPQGDLF